MTNEELAIALGVSERGFYDLKKRGLPLPLPGEDPKAWAIRAEHWRKQNRRPPGRKLGGERTPEQAEFDARYLQARAMMMELKATRLKQELHSRKQCQAEHSRRVRQVTAAMMPLGRTVAASLCGRTPDVVQAIVEEEVRRRLMILSNGGMPDDADEALAGEAAPDNEQPPAVDDGKEPPP